MRLKGGPQLLLPPRCNLIFKLGSCLQSLEFCLNTQVYRIDAIRQLYNLWMVGTVRSCGLRVFVFQFSFTQAKTLQRLSAFVFADAIKATRRNCLVRGLLLHAIFFRGRQLLVQFIELAGNNILLVVDHEDVMFPLVRNQLLLRFLNCRAQLSQLCRKEFGCAICGLIAGADIVVDKNVDQSIYDSGV